MSIEALQLELTKLSPEEQQSVQAFIGVLMKRRDPERLYQTAARLDNNTPGYWTSLEDAQTRWAADDEDLQAE